MTAAEPTPSKLDNLLRTRDEAYQRMRHLVPQADDGPLQRTALTAHQQAAVDAYDQLNTEVARARASLHRHGH